jgi:uncharacterized caspase-like protein
LGALHRLSRGSEEATPETAPESLRDIRPAEPEDAVFVYFAGHGASAQSHFYMIPHDLGYQGHRDELNRAAVDAILAHSISDEDLMQAFETIDAGKVVLVIDSCNSGQALEAAEKRRGPMNSKGLAQLAYEKGMYILTASQNYQLALEFEQLGHGLMTFALVEEGLKGFVPGVGRGGELDVREWLDYAARRVPELQQNMVSESRSIQRGSEQENSTLRAIAAQQPRVFYRREPDLQPLIIGKFRAKP